MRKSDSFVLSIGGIDPSTGAGVFSDIKTFEHLSMNGLAVSTCLTYQSHDELINIEWFSMEQIKNQLKPLIGAYAITACKIGLVKNWLMLKEIVGFLKSECPAMKIVLDPVLISSSGYEICKAPHEVLRDEVLSDIYVITPNTSEFKALKLDPEIQYSCHIYYKSVQGKILGTDLLIETSGRRTKFTLNELGSEKHGSGCVFSSALAAFLSKGETIEQACKQAKNIIEKYLTSNTNLIGTLN